MDKTKINNLPLMKHFEGSQIKDSVDSFRKGEKGLFFWVKLIALVAVCYLAYVYVLPPVFVAIGKALALVATGVIVVVSIALLPVFLKALRRFTRFLHKLVIKHDPFGELYEQREALVANKTKFQRSHGGIKNLQSQMEVDAAEEEEKATAFQSKILTAQKKANKLKARMEKAVADRGAAAKGEDDYVNDHAELNTIIFSTHELRLAAELADSVYVIGYPDDTQEYATIVKKYDLKAMGLAWRPFGKDHLDLVEDITQVMMNS